MTSRAIYQFMNYNFPTSRAVVTQNYYSKGDFVIVDIVNFMSVNSTYIETTPKVFSCQSSHFDTVD